MRKIKPENFMKGEIQWRRDPGITLLDFEHLEFPYGYAERTMEQVRTCTQEILEKGELPFLTGGEHLTMLGAFQAVFQKYPNVQIIHFDARADLREEFLGERLTHACMMRRCWEMVGDGRIYQFGIRSGGREEFRWADGHVKIYRSDFRRLETVLKKLKGSPVYFTVDMDVLDPAVFPGAGLPEPGGVSVRELTDAAILVCRRARVVGCDVSELSECCDSSGISAGVARSVVREMLQALYESRK